MKNVLNALEVNEKDNILTAFAKGMGKGYVKSTAVTLPVIGALLLIGKMVSKKVVENGEDVGA